VNTPEGYSGQSNTHFFQAKFDGQEITNEQKGDWLHDMWEHGLHIIPCGSPHEIVPAYYRKRHPFDDELALKSKWAKTPRINWSHYQNIQPSDQEIQQWHEQYPQANWAAITGISFVVIDADSDEAVDWIGSGSITQTPLIQRTPRGGAHYFYGLGTNEIKTGAGARKIDTRGKGGRAFIRVHHVV
jgi:hypothetical protein